MKGFITHLIAVFVGIAVSSAMFALILTGGDKPPVPQIPVPTDSGRSGPGPNSPFENPAMLPPSSGQTGMVGAPGMVPPPEMGPGTQGMNQSSSEVAGPYTAYPLSFPKVFAGILYFEKKHPENAITSEQCMDILPVMEVMGEIWWETLKIADKLQLLLTPEQEAFIRDNKKVLETSTGMNKAMEIINRMARNQPEFHNTNDLFGAAIQLCRIRADEGGSDKPYPRAKGKVLITHFDITSGIFLMESDPALRITPLQARYMGPLLQTLAGLNAIVETSFYEILGKMKEKQIDIVTSEIKDITELKFSIFEKAPKKRTKDPLYEEVMKLCRTRTSASIDLF